MQGLLSTELYRPIQTELIKYTHSQITMQTEKRIITSLSVLHKMYQKLDISKIMELNCMYMNIPIDFISPKYYVG